MKRKLLVSGILFLGFFLVIQAQVTDPRTLDIQSGITIKIDGDIANVVFETKSGDRVFDQFVSKAIEEANPLPPIPPALKKQRYEIGFRFKPGSIQ